MIKNNTPLYGEVQTKGACLKFLIIIALASLSLPVLAEELSQESFNHLTITSVEVQDVTDKYQGIDRRRLQQRQQARSKSISNIENLGGWIDNLTQVEVIVDKVINIGNKIWNVIEKGRPVANYRQKKATATPENISNWQQLEGWSNPQSRAYQIIYKNIYGIEVVKIVYRIIFLTGGSYKGQGKYIGYVSVEPQQVSVLYGWSLDMQASVENVFNKGTVWNPLAGMILTVKWNVKTVLNDEQQSQSYNIDGLGNFSVL